MDRDDRSGSGGRRRVFARNLKAPWLLVSVLAGIAGFILLISRPDANRHGSTIVPDGGQSMVLITLARKLVICSTVSVKWMHIMISRTVSGQERALF